MLVGKARLLSHRQRTLLLTAQQAARALGLSVTLSYQAPQRPYGWIQVDATHTVGLHHRWGTLCYKQTYLTFAPEGDIIFIILDRKQTCPLLCFPRVVSAYAHKTFRNVTDPWRFVSPQGHTLYLLVGKWQVSGTAPVMRNIVAAISEKYICYHDVGQLIFQCFHSHILKNEDLIICTT